MSNANKTMVGGTHYTNMAIQPWDVIDTWPHEQRVGAYRMNVLKYILRYQDKNGVEDLRKARHYLDKLIEVENTPEPSQNRADEVLFMILSNASRLIAGAYRSEQEAVEQAYKFKTLYPDVFVTQIPSREWIDVKLEDGWTWFDSAYDVL